MHETLYPLLQGYDSVALRTDLEIGGTDQVFNMLIGRELMDKMLNKEKFVLTCPMVLGIDGKTMSKSSGNCVWIEDPPEQMFGKIMSIPDQLIISYLELLTNLPTQEIQQYQKSISLKKVNPRDIKEKLAFEIVKTFHSLTAAQKSREEFRNVFREKKIPVSVHGINIRKKEIPLLDLLTETGLVSSKSEAKRMVLQGGVKIDGKAQKDWRRDVEIKKEMILQIGKRKFAKIKPPA
jgi:tyrosyl-tRNA synthetase